MSNWRRSHAWLLGPLSIVLLTSLATSGAGATDPVAGGQGTDTSLPATPSQLTVSGRGKFANLAITVNQTANLTSQAVSVTWTGGAPTLSGPGRFGSQFLQIMQCWGDDDGTVSSNPGPPPEQCEQGAVSGTPEGLPGSLYPNPIALTREISRSTWPNFDPRVGHLDTRTTQVWRPFRAVDGTTVDIPTDPNFNPAIVGGNFWLNPYFNQITTNEIAGAATGPDGKGAELFQVLTGVDSSGLGCGQMSQPAVGGGKVVPKCWIVVVPRGTPTEEDAGTAYEATADQSGVVTSPVSPAAWQHRIAIPISFNPIDSPCTFGAEERRIAGTELALPAISSWQPSLCANGAPRPYSYVPVSDSSARQQLVSGQSGAPGMAVVSRPLGAESTSPQRPLVYAPISASGVVIGFNIERNPLPRAASDVQQLAGVRVADINLTPRLVAKLLTQSYRDAVDIQQAPNYPWLPTNPVNMGADRDFLQFNPEFSLLQISEGRTFSSLQLPAGNSDAAEQVWAWILADPEAQAWMAGAADEWGMKVNPVYATTAAANSSGVAFGTPLPSSFPKADPYCYQAPPRGTNDAIVPPPLCGTDWVPYRRSFADAAQVARAASDGAKILENPNAISASQVWSRVPPQYLGRRNMIALTDSPSAAQFGLQMARLSRAGDNGATRSFIAADGNGLGQGIEAMAPRTEPTVLEPSPTAIAPSAYPLTTLTYAVVSPLALDSAARAEYASFIDYAAGPGQLPGLELGQLPRGYVPLPDVLKAQAAAAANLVRTMSDPPPDATTTTSSPVTTDAPPSMAPAATTAAPSQAEAPPESQAPTSASVPKSTVPVSTTRTTSPSSAGPSTIDPATVVPDTASAVIAPLATDGAPTSVAPVAQAPADLPDQAAAASPSAVTPIVSLARSRYAVPGFGVIAVFSALGALEITKRPRRQVAQAGTDPCVVHEIEQDG